MEEREWRGETKKVKVAKGAGQSEKKKPKKKSTVQAKLRSSVFAFTCPKPNPKTGAKHKQPVLCYWSTEVAQGPGI